MMQLALMRLLGLGVLLAGTVALELTTMTTAADGGGTVADPPPPARPSPATALLTPPGDPQALVADILARPLFATNRHPAAPLDVAAPPRPSLPRLAGTLVNGHSRSAIFAATGEGRPVVVQEGAQVSGYTVRSIEGGKVTLSGPNGQQVLRPAFDTRSQDVANGPAITGLAAKGTPPFAAVANVMQPLHGLPGFSGAAAR